MPASRVDALDYSRFDKIVDEDSSAQSEDDLFDELGGLRPDGELSAPPAEASARLSPPADSSARPRGIEAGAALAGSAQTPPCPTPTPAAAAAAAASAAWPAESEEEGEADGPDPGASPPPTRAPPPAGPAAAPPAAPASVPPGPPLPPPPPLGEERYDGEVDEAGLRHGYGRFTWKNGDGYEGLVRLRLALPSRRRCAAALSWRLLRGHSAHGCCGSRAGSRAAPDCDLC